jgi:hypothetical protein
VQNFWIGNVYSFWILRLLSLSRNVSSTPSMTILEKPYLYYEVQSPEAAQDRSKTGHLFWTCSPKDLIADRSNSNSSMMSVQDQQFRLSQVLFHVLNEFLSVHDLQLHGKNNRETIISYEQLLGKQSCSVAYLFARCSGIPASSSHSLITFCLALIPSGCNGNIILNTTRQPTAEVSIGKFINVEQVGQIKLPP